MNQQENTIPSAELSALFPGVEDRMPLEVNSILFSFLSPEMPFLLPYEQLVIAAVIRRLQPLNLLEFGTGQGQTTFAMAANSPPEAEVVTIDLKPSDWAEYTRKCLRGDDAAGSCFRDGPYADKIKQTFRDADGGLPEVLGRMKGKFDYIHVDADHGYEEVGKDTLAALDLAGPDAVITWHDFYMFPEYLKQGRERRGVFPYLNELAAEGGIVLRHIIGTYLVAGSRRWTQDTPGVLLQPGETPSPFGERIVRLKDAGGS